MKAVAEAHLRRVDRKIAELDGLRGTLATLVARCRGDARPECPILEDLAEPRSPDERRLPFYAKPATARTKA